MKQSLLLDLRDTLYRYRWQYFKATLTLLVSNLLLVVNPLLFRQALMAVETSKNDSEGWISRILGSYYTSLWLWVALLLTIAAISGCCKYLMRIGFISISREAECLLREKLFKKIDAQSKLFFDHHPVGDLLSRLTNDISVYRDVLGPGIMYPIYCVTLVVPGIIALFTISVPLACVALMPIFIIPVINSFSRNLIYATSKEVQHLLSSISAMVQEHFSGIEIIKCYGMDGHLGAEFERVAQKLAADNTRLATLQGLLYPFFALVTKITTLLLVLFAGALIIKGWGKLTTADFISFMWLQSYIYIPILMMGWVLPVYEMGRASYDHLLEIYNDPVEVSDEEGSKMKISADADIELTHLSYCYPQTERRVLDDINLRIKSGEFVGITGPVGSGKSTLFKLLNRDYEIPRGQLVIGSYDVHDYSLSALQQAIVIVEQMPFLFSKSIAENVAIGQQLATQQQIEIVSEYADLHETVLGFPEKYETVIGERGVTLSGGQKQRVVIARALLARGSIYLFDDIFSAVDTSTEHKIFKTIKKQCKNKTVLLTTHRISILNQLDRIIILDGGKVIEDGSPQDLIAKKGYYWALSELQNSVNSDGNL